MKITTEMTLAAYQAAKDVYHDRMSKNDALESLEVDHGMNRGSASDYIVNFKKMMDGEKYIRTNNAETTDYFLTQIFSDYGVVKLGGAIKAANEHVDYYEGLGRGNLNGIRTIISRHEKIIRSQLVTDYPDELNKPETLFEGIRKTVIVNSYERNPIAREKCIEHYGAQCVVCDFNFEKEYGDIGKGFIHVHHLTQLSDIRQGYEVNPVNDLRPVCPNCHAMLHKKQPPLTIDELKSKAHNKKIQRTV
jgi:5-methylcytosine-specific restriction protein A